MKLLACFLLAATACTVGEEEIEEPEEESIEAVRYVTGVNGNFCIASTFNSHDATIELRKVVKDSTATNERAGDYLPLVRANGVRSANLVFSVPGFGLGGATTDHFVAGTKFQRVQVSTFSGVPSITIPLWTKNAAGRYLTHSGDLRFFYGFVRASDGVKRFGWLAEDALQTSTGC